jgi:hypothetical protein
VHAASLDGALSGDDWLMRCRIDRGRWFASRRLLGGRRAADWVLVARGLQRRRLGTAGAQMSQFVAAGRR